MAWRMVRKLDVDLGAVGEPRHPAQERSSLTVVLGAVVLVDNKPIDARVPRAIRRAAASRGQQPGAANPRPILATLVVALVGRRSSPLVPGVKGDGGVRETCI